MISLIIGGSSSGKSLFAENLAIEHCGEKLYIATMQPFDNECTEKILKHREMREHKGFVTAEIFTDLNSFKNPVFYDCILLECLSNLLANMLFSGNVDLSDPKTKEEIISSVLDGISLLENSCNHLIVVSNDIFFDNINYSDETLLYINILAKINNEIGKKSKRIAELVYSLPIIHKGDFNG